MPPQSGSGPTFNLMAVLQYLQSEINKLTDKVNGVDYCNYGIPKKDPSNSLSQNRATTDSNCRVVTGYVTDCLASIGWYNVQIDDGSYIPCGLMSETTSAVTGVKRVGTLPAGSRVFVIINNALRTGSIIGADPGWSASKNPGIHDYISQASTNCLNTDGYQQHYRNFASKLLAFQQNGAIDETTIGEWGRMTENGTAVFVDSFMSFIRADENCGFWAFWHDQLARIHGHNLQIRSPALDVNSFDDEDELSVITGVSPYLWESLGASKPGLQLAINRPEQVVQTIGSQYATGDLAVKGQLPFHRLTRFEGFLGQGFKQQLVLPVQGPSIKALDTPTPSPAVWEEHLALDGNYHLVSSQGIMIAHVPVFGEPVQKKLPEDATGDNRVNGYDPAGLNGTQKLAPGPLGADGVAGIGTALKADDELAYGMKWRSTHPFHYHSKDWQAAQDYATEVPQGYNALSYQQYLNKPDPQKLIVDHREEANYHPTLSFVSILRDGTVVIAGPAGEEIRMGGGNIEISCPGDIQLRPGRSCITMAGRDAIVKAKSNVDISATDQDVRIKSENNMQLLSGNSGRGGMLIENKSKTASQDYTFTGTEVVSNGVVIKSTSAVVANAPDIYIRAGLEDKFGSITLDAAKGKGVITSYATQTVTYVEDSVVNHFGKPDKVQSSNYHGAIGTIISGSLQVAGPGFSIFNGGCIFNNHVVVANGNVFAEFSNGFLTSFDKKTKKLIEEAFEDVKKAEKSLKTGGERFYKLLFTNFIYADNYFGNYEVMKRTGFSFRSTDQCKVPGYVLFESRWAQRARATGQELQGWKEKSVQANEYKTYPFPGADIWLGRSYVEVTNSLYTNGANGLGPKPPGPDYENASANINPIGVSPEGKYPIIS